MRLPLAVLLPILAGLPLLGVAWVMPPLSPATPATTDGESAPGGQARQVQTVRELLAKLPGDATATKVEQALRAVERRGATSAEKQRALAAAQEALEQRKLDAASAREGLYRLSERLRGVKSMEEVAKALKDGDAKAAAAELEKLAGGQLGEGAGDGAEAGAEQLARQADLDRLLQEAGRADGKPDARPVSSAAP